jgi:hypothetical protein
MYPMKFNNKKSREQGSVILFTVLILGSMLAITLSLAAIYIPKIRAITDSGAGSVGAIYSADSAIEWCIYINRGNPVLPQPTMSNGATYTLTPTDCTTTPMNNQAVGTFHGVSRSLQVTTP